MTAERYKFNIKKHRNFLLLSLLATVIILAGVIDIVTRPDPLIFGQIGDKVEQAFNISDDEVYDFDLNSNFSRGRIVIDDNGRHVYQSRLIFAKGIDEIKNIKVYQAVCSGMKDLGYQDVDKICDDPQPFFIPQLTYRAGFKQNNKSVYIDLSPMPDLIKLHDCLQNHKIPVSSPCRTPLQDVGKTLFQLQITAVE